MKNVNASAAIDDLISKLGTELTFIDHKLAKKYLISSDQISVFSWQFPDHERQEIARAVKKQEPFQVDAYQYSIAASLRKEFLQLLKCDAKDESINVLCLTLQSSDGIDRLLSKNKKQLIALVAERLPRSIKVAGEIRQRHNREIGRKIGYAAKDLAALRTSRLTASQLAKLENAGSKQARDAVCKTNVVEKLELERLKGDGTPPAIAYLAVKFWRMLAVRPADDKSSRKHYHKLVPKFFECLLAQDSTSTARIAIKKLLADAAIDSKKVLGTQMASVVRSLSWSKVFQNAYEIENESSDRGAWQLAADSLASTKRSEASELPKRLAKPLEGLRREGPDAQTDEVGKLTESFGLTGLEIGNWVNRSEGEVLVRLVTSAFSDLVALIGPWLTTLVQEGGLALSLGARGGGKGCASYNPNLKVINLTKTRGDGSLAHEVGHFVDHMLARQMPSSSDQSGFLSGRVMDSGDNDVPPVVDAMSNVMNVIQKNGLRNEVVSSIKANRRYREKLILSAMKEGKNSHQKAFDLIVAKNERQFVFGKDALERSKVLVNSIAKWTGQPVDIKIRYFECTEYFKNANKLTKYWYEPHELFARAFESFIEDSLVERGWVNEFLVSGTRASYEQCRGLPYPTGKERTRINKAIGVLIKEIAKLQES